LGGGCERRWECGFLVQLGGNGWGAWAAVRGGLGCARIGRVSLLAKVAQVKSAALLVVGIVAAGAAYGDEPISKAACDAVLTSEVKRLEDGFARTRDAWEKSVEQRFLDHKELTPAELQTARTTFNDAVMELSAEHLKAVALPGMYRMMLAIPRYDLGVCARPADMRSMGDQAIAGFLLKLTALLPLVDTSVESAKIHD
jgi:hypothetical protein